ncbi:hypothetical protein SASPL_107158 [Salvia splendens]|uniref:Transposase MuDR plant domain-containing protein n=1 Tax=Salvia splendens TaxID=180675 RepID=A0A8X9A715_SALSN|nr:hypothetical protein SASPL_107158 [Salvia splendens]
MTPVQNLHFGVGRSHNLETEHSSPLGTLAENHDHDLDLRSVDGGDIETGLSQEESGADNHDRRLTATSSVDELHFSEDNELAVLENCEIDENFEVMHQSTELVVVSSPLHSIMQPQVLTTSPIVQSRTLSPLPTHEFIVGQEFSDVKSCRRALRDMAIVLHFEIQTVKSDKSRFTAKCASEGCPWRVHASKLPGVPTFTIRTIYSEHNCGGIAHLGHQQASVEWVANSVEERLRENPHYKSKEILEDIHRAHGITLSYKQAWRGRERFTTSLRGSFEDDYRLLPQYCNPDKTDQSGETVLKNKYLGTLLFATSFDGDGGLFPLAFSVFDEENDES